MVSQLLTSVISAGICAQVTCKALRVVSARLRREGAAAARAMYEPATRWEIDARDQQPLLESPPLQAAPKAAAQVNTALSSPSNRAATAVLFNLCACSLLHIA
jgi:hypothetical protein